MNVLKLIKFTVKFGFKHAKDYNYLKQNYNQEHFDKIVIDYCEGALASMDVTYEIKDLSKDKLYTNALYISNHNSMYDSLISAIAVRKKHSYFIASEFEYALKIPIIGNVMRFIHSIFVDRSNLRAGIKAIKQGTENLEANLNLVIFAEGEISRYVLKPNQQYIGDFHAGSFKPALVSQRPIVPITIVGSDKIHNSQNMFSKVNSGHVKVIIGEPITKHLTEKLSSVEIANITREQILKTYCENID